ncbi:MAG: phage tail protein [Deltaproteobacteria bacterium]|nr:phage tail protein [Deltaproteobacteria bacterium]
MFAGNFAPRGWALCDGQLLAVSSNTSLFAILGTTYGGDGRVTFGLPDLRGRFAMHPGNGPGLSARQLGEAGGDERVTLNESQLPSHSHQVAQHAHPEPVSDVFEAAPGTGDESEALPTTASTQVSTSNTGGGQPVQTMPPFRTVNYIICTQGSFPSRQ